MGKRKTPVSNYRAERYWVALLSEVIEEDLAESDPPNAEQLRQAREQFKLPEFGIYLAGRLGLV
jgi:hypothetical protein